MQAFKLVLKKFFSQVSKKKKNIFSGKLSSYIALKIFRAELSSNTKKLFFITDSKFLRKKLEFYREPFESQITVRFIGKDN